MPLHGGAIGAAGVAAAWTCAVWATVQELGRRLRRRDAAAAALQPGPPAGLPGWPPLCCACPLDGGDAADGFAALQDAGPAAPAGLLAYPGTLHAVFLADETDVAATQRAHRHAAWVRAVGRSAEVGATRPLGCNRKAAQLAHLTHLARLPASPVGVAPYVLTLDSDVAPDSVRAAQLVAQLHAAPQLGALWQPAVPAARGPCLGDWLGSAVLGAGAHAMPLLAALDARSPVGKVMLLRPEALAAAGGFAAGVDELGDDVGMGRRLLAAGWAVDAASGPPARAPRRGQPSRDVARRLLRWIAVVRQQRPRLRWAYPLFFAHLPLLLGLWATAGLLGAKTATCAGGAGLAVLTRLQLGWLARRSCGHAPGGWRLLQDVFGGDLALLALYLYAATGPATYWNGRRLPAASAR